MTSLTILTTIAALLGLVSGLWHLNRLLQFLQLHEYLNHRFLGWSLANWRRVIAPAEGPALVAALLAWAIVGWQPTGLAWGVLVIWGVGLGASIVRGQRQRAEAIKPLVYTARVKRLLAGAVIVVGLEVFWLARLAGSGTSPDAAFFGGLVGLTLLPQAAFINVMLANLLLFPVEEGFRQYFIQTARRKIRSLNPVVIGITGSYGKTSSKDILAHFLGTRYPVLKTPRSYNTLMGICQVIREDLQPAHKYFVVEMGAYKPGEIARLCRLTRPRYGILTAVGPQHLERFKSIEQVARAKNELIEALPPDGLAVMNGDDPIVRCLAGGANCLVQLYGLQDDDAELTLRAAGIEIAGEQTRFELIAAAETLEARTNLLGRHNVSNILAAAAVARACAVPLPAIVRSLAGLPPVEHRLQLVNTPAGVRYLDDSYNANPIGAAMALEVLSLFQDGRKFLVTPGMVELGELEAAENIKFGGKAARVCNFVFLIGRTAAAQAVGRGLAAAGFDPAHIFRCDTLDLARQTMRELVRPGDVILFENDLPDLYIG